MHQPKLFMLLLGCKPHGRNTEQHDTFFAIGDSLNSVVPQILAFWPGAGPMHIDGWREITNVNGHAVTLMPRDVQAIYSENRLFFLNLGGYKKDEFEEFHYKMLAVGSDKGAAIKESKQTAFYKHSGFKGAESHIDDRYGVDVDDIYEIREILPTEIKERYQLHVASEKTPGLPEDQIHLGYFKLDAL